ncbi:MAG: 30S ribosomal protein S21 [Planctomycetota bacterium]|jgi:small subunit ribosomal protein S21
MLKVKARSGESVQQMIKRFKKLCEKEGLIKDMKRNAYYEKPSEKNRRRVRKHHILNFKTNPSRLFNYQLARLFIYVLPFKYMPLLECERRLFTLLFNPF